MTDKEAEMWASLFWMVLSVLSWIIGMLGICFGSFLGGLICLLLGFVFMGFAGSYRR